MKPEKMRSLAQGISACCKLNDDGAAGARSVPIDDRISRAQGGQGAVGILLLPLYALIECH